MFRLSFNGTRLGSTNHRPVPAGVDITQYWPMYLCSDTGTDDLLQGDARLNPVGHANVTTIVVATNRGRVWNLFDNPHHIGELLDFGLRPDTAFACAFRYLFRPRPEVVADFQPTWDRLADPAVLAIGIQVRIGDQVFRGIENDTGEDAWRSAAPYFECAAEIERSRALSGQTVLYFLVSDSLALRRMAKARLGDKVLTDVDTPSAHSTCFDGGACTLDAQVRALRQAAGDMLSFSKADYHVYTDGSGYGRVGAWMSLHWHHQYAVSVGNGAGGVRRCGMNDYDDLRVDARVRAGVR
jgi:hypothetical protein